MDNQGSNNARQNRAIELDKRITKLNSAKRTALWADRVISFYENEEAVNKDIFDICPSYSILLDMKAEATSILENGANPSKQSGANGRSPVNRSLNHDPAEQARSIDKDIMFLESSEKNEFWCKEVDKVYLEASNLSVEAKSKCQKLSTLTELNKIKKDILVAFDLDKQIEELDRTKSLSKEWCNKVKSLEFSIKGNSVVPYMKSKGVFDSLLIQSRTYLQVIEDDEYEKSEKSKDQESKKESARFIKAQGIDADITRLEADSYSDQWCDEVTALANEVNGLEPEVKNKCKRLTTLEGLKNIIPKFKQAQVLDQEVIKHQKSRAETTSWCNGVINFKAGIDVSLLPYMKQKKTLDRLYKLASDGLKVIAKKNQRASRKAKRQAYWQKHKLAIVLWSIDGLALVAAALLSALFLEHIAIFVASYLAITYAFIWTFLSGGMGPAKITMHTIINAILMTLCLVLGWNNVELRFASIAMITGLLASSIIMTTLGAVKAKFHLSSDDEKGEYVCSMYSSCAELLSIVILVSLFFQGWIRYLIIGGGVFVIFATLIIIDEAVAYGVMFFDVGVVTRKLNGWILVGVGILLLFFSRYTTFIAIVTFVVALANFIVDMVVDGEDFVIIFIIIAVIHVVTSPLILMTRYGVNDYVMVGDKFKGYYGNEEVVFVPEGTKIISGGCFGRSNIDKDCVKTVVIPEGVEVIKHHAFYNLNNLEIVILPHSVKTIERNAFASCEKLRIVRMGENVETIGYSAFNSCTSLAEITLPDTLKTIGYSAFAYCTSLKQITIPNSVEALGCENGNGTFMGCTSLESVTLSSSLKVLGSNLFKSTKIKEIVVPEGVISVHKNAFNDCTMLEKVQLPSTVTELTKKTFADCPIKELHIPAGVTSLDAGALKGMTKLEKLIIPDSITAITGMFSTSCPNLKELSLGNGIKLIGINSFNNCTSLETVYIGSNVERIDSGAFAGCTRLKTIFYDGTRDDWDRIVKHTDNSWLSPAWDKNTGDYNIIFLK